MIQEAVLYFVYEGCVTICQCDTCVDTLPDCAEYTKSSCTAPYVNWAYSNCKAYCGFCRKYKRGFFNLSDKGGACNGVKKVSLGHCLSI